GLEADDLPAAEVDQWLEEGNKFAGLDAPANFLLELQPLGEFSLQFLIEPGECVATGSLRRVKGHVAVTQHGFLSRTIAQPGEADRGRDVNLRSFDQNRFRENLLN